MLHIKFLCTIVALYFSISLMWAANEDGDSFIEKMPVINHSVHTLIKEEKVDLAIVEIGIAIDKLEKTDGFVDHSLQSIIDLADLALIEVKNQASNHLINDEKCIDDINKLLDIKRRCINRSPAMSEKYRREMQKKQVKWTVLEYDRLPEEFRNNLRNLTSTNNSKYDKFIEEGMMQPEEAAFSASVNEIGRGAQCKYYLFENQGVVQVQINISESKVDCYRTLVFKKKTEKGENLGDWKIFYLSKSVLFRSVNE